MKSTLKAILIFIVCVFSIALLSACGGSSESDKPTLYTYDPGDAFTTNIKDSKKILKCQIEFRLTDSKAATAYAGEESAVVRDIINKFFMGCNESDLININLDDLGQKLIAALNTGLETDCFYSVYFTSYITA